MKKITVLAALLLLLCRCDRDRYIAIGGYAQGGTYTVKLNMKGVREEPRRIQQDIHPCYFVLRKDIEQHSCCFPCLRNKPVGSTKRCQITYCAVHSKKQGGV